MSASSKQPLTILDKAIYNHNTTTENIQSFDKGNTLRLPNKDYIRHACKSCSNQLKRMLDLTRYESIDSASKRSWVCSVPV